MDLGLGALLQLVSELIDLRAPFSDDDPRPRRLDVDLQLVGEPLDVHLRDPGVRQALLQLLAQLDVLMKVVLVFLRGEPSRVPGPVEPEPKTVGMNFLAHVYPSAS